MKKKWISYTVISLLLIFIVCAATVSSYKEKRVDPPKTYELQDAEKPSDGFLFSAEQALQADGNAATLTEHGGRSGVVEWLEGTKLSWTVMMPEAGEYELSIGYLPLAGKGQPIDFTLAANGEKIGDEFAPLELARVYYDEPGELKRSGGNEIWPKQLEGGVWQLATVQAPGEFGDGNLRLSLKQGSNTIELESLREQAAIEYIHLAKAEAAPDYSAYKADATNDGADSAADANNVKGQTSDEPFLLTIQAENAFAKSDAGLFPTVDRTSPLTTPYHPYQLRINTIGASNWDIPGQWIDWKFEVPEDGWYKIGARYHQSKVKGMFVSRKMELDGKRLFQEMDALRFPYVLDWAVNELGGEDGEPYLFYLTKGEHVLKLEVTLGDVTETAKEVQDIVYDLNQIYRNIVMVTGMNPDPYRDYDIDKTIPELPKLFRELADRMQAEADRLDAMSGQSGTGSRTLRILVRQLESFIDRPDGIPKRLANFKNNVAAIADWLLTIKQQPLELDYLYVASPDAKKPKAEAGLAARATHEIRAFAGSFLQNYDALEAEGESGESIQVWIGLGRDQAYVLKRMIDESFIPETGIGVELNLVGTSLVTAVMAGEGPDVNLFTSRGDTMNLAFRGALEPLDEWQGFDSLKNEFKNSAFVPYEYGNRIYGIPDDQEFFMMFYRKDVLGELGIEPPQTWDDVMKIAPILQNNNMGIGLPYENLDAFQLLTKGIGALNLYPTLLMQNGSGIYNEEQTGTRLHEPEAFKAFKQWTDFYNLYDYALYKDDLNRFRTGEMPIVISSYKLYTRLAAAAPEITGTWAMAPIPGMPQSDGSIDRATGATGTAGIMLKDTKNKEAAWKFLQWWNSAEVQAQFVNELENEMGVLGRRLPANTEAIDATRWSRADQASLNEQWDQVTEIPELPGGYYTLRNLDNAFRETVFQKRNARETLFYWNKDINDEIERKRYEFGVEQ
ncbi:extracellular solute-binding protein [Paenibacillus sp. LHD-117]|uniref:extracellular solute-binding protein n=1 Tax=Paenibacillus sp. LHD-117 TaxID=3071412 RepID=UPI0027E1D368|nr:extracellular solute-binding protein [Paenibacillus sp. LHD-117]MDQ6420292.1 extracellular solute-binding protein [Paenibacillus sp. LHD-117]